jgi:hypothetical protein
MNYTSTQRPSPSSNVFAVSPKIKKDVIKIEIARLLDVGFIKEVYHPDWRICVIYTDLNKACKKDPFGVVQINQVGDSTTGYILLSFFDCYSGYHQILLKEEDQIKMYFITLFSAFCYPTILFRLKSAGAIYQRGINGVYILNSGVTLKCMFTMWSSRLEKMRDSSLI